MLVRLRKALGEKSVGMRTMTHLTEAMSHILNKKPQHTEVALMRAHNVATALPRSHPLRGAIHAAYAAAEEGDMEAARTHTRKAWHHARALAGAAS